MIGFGSLGMLGNDSSTILHNQILSSVGVGVYMKNDFLAFSSFQIRVAYFPVTPDGISHFGISFSTIGLINQASLLFTKPKVVDYK
jgi:Na+-transporting NADH:ubiquinone oxidoreductase subunit NqrE